MSGPSGPNNRRAAAAKPKKSPRAKHVVKTKAAAAGGIAKTKGSAQPPE